MRSRQLTQMTPSTPPCTQRAGSSRAFALWLRTHARLALLLLLVASGILGPLAQNAGTLFPTAAAHGLNASAAQAKPAPFDPHASATSVNHKPPHTLTTVDRATDTPAPMSPLSGITMPQGLLPLAPDAAATFLGQDKRFEVDAPAGAITAADQAAAGGALQLAIRQVAPASGSSAGGSGLVSFGGYLVQVVDGNGVLVNQGLRKPITLKMHLPTAASALDLGHAFAVFNSSPPVGVSSAPTSAITPDTRSGASVSDTIPGLGPYSSQSATYDPAQQALATSYTLSSPSALMSFDSDSPVASFGHPDPFNVDLNAGGLTTSIPLDIPSGPGGLTPPVALTYSSAGVSEQHNIQAAAGWVGEG